MLDNTTATNQLKVLLLDDDDFSHEVISSMLQKLGIHDLHTAINGKSGLVELGKFQSPPDLLICDLIMPDMDGMDFLSALAKINYKGKIILLSGIENDVLNIAERVTKEDGLNVVGAYEKPLKLEQLRMAVE